MNSLHSQGIMLFSKSDLIPQSYISTLLSETEVLYIYIYALGNKDYFRKLFWTTMAVNINADEVRDTV